MEFSPSGLGIVMEMTASRKRLHKDLEEGDECLPISKRIHSLHIEAQAYGKNVQDNYEVNSSPPVGFCDNTSMASLSSSFSSIENPHQNVLPPLLPHDHALKGDISSIARLPITPEQSIRNEHELRHGHAVEAFLCASEPCSALYRTPNLDSATSQAQTPESYQQQQTLVHILDHSFHGQYYQPGKFPSSCHEYKYCDSVNSSHSVNENIAFSHLIDASLSSYQNLSPSSHVQFHTFQSNDQSAVLDSQSQQVPQLNIHSCPSAVTHLNNMTEYSHAFHQQQLPTGTYEPELGIDENPYYFSVNQMLYEAHLLRVRREKNFSDSS